VSDEVHLQNSDEVPTPDLIQIRKQKHHPKVAMSPENWTPTSTLTNWNRAKRTYWTRRIHNRKPPEQHRRRTEPRWCGGQRHSSHHHLAYLHRKVKVWMGREWVAIFCLERVQRESWDLFWYIFLIKTILHLHPSPKLLIFCDPKSIGKCKL
jgi:hypothetical protein